MPDEHEHPSDETLLDYADGALESGSIRTSVAAHIASCESCSATIDEYRTITTSIHSEETWWLAERIASRDTPQVLRELALRIENEDTEAKRLLGDLLESPYRFAYANISRPKRFHTGGVVRLLCQAARDECMRNTRFAQVLAETAATIAELLPDDHYPQSGIHDLRGIAWLHYGSACAYLAQFNGGHDALARANRAFQKLQDHELQLGRVELARALLLTTQRRNDQALYHARLAAQRFERHADTKRHLEAKEWEAAILHRLGKPEIAHATYLATYEFATAAHDAEMTARAATNLAICCRERGDVTSARRYLDEALQHYEALGYQGMVVHTRWSLTRVSLVSGDTASMAQDLPALIAEMEALGMIADASCARADLAKFLQEHADTTDKKLR